MLLFFGYKLLVHFFIQEFLLRVTRECMMYDTGIRTLLLKVGRNVVGYQGGAEGLLILLVGEVSFSTSTSVFASDYGSPQRI